MGDQCVLVRPAAPVEGSTGLSYASGVSAATTGSRGLCLELATLAPGLRGRAHLHAEHESAAYVLAGEIEMSFGDQLGERLVARAGDFVYIPAGVVHRTANASATEPAIAVLARTDADEQESVIPRPELDDLPRLIEANSE